MTKILFNKIKESFFQTFSGRNMDNIYDDVPYVDDTEYITNIKIEKEDIDEEETEKIETSEEGEPEEVEKSEKVETDEEVPESGENQFSDTSGGEDQFASTGETPGMDIGGMDEEDDAPKTPEEAGRTYELKKIYSRLLSIDSYLADSTDDVLLKLRNYVDQAIEMFEIVIANHKIYKNKIDEIIVLYYNFLRIVYSLLKSYYEIESKEDK